MKKKVICLVVTVMLFVISCSNNSHKISSENTDSISDTETSPKYETYYNASGDLVIYNPPETENAVRLECTIHDERYHSFPYIANIVTQEEYENWIKITNKKSINSKEECNLSVNICDFIEYFNITKSDYELFYYSEGLYGHNPDILFSGDGALVEEYYRCEVNQENLGSNLGIDHVKSRIKYGINPNKIRIIYPPYDDFFETTEIPQKYTQLPLTAWTLADLFFDLKFNDEEIIRVCEAFSVEYILNFNNPFALNSYLICQKVAELREQFANGKNPTEIKSDENGNLIFGDSIEETIQYYKKKSLEERCYFNYKPLFEDDYYDFYNY